MRGPGDEEGLLRGDFPGSRVAPYLPTSLPPLLTLAPRLSYSLASDSTAQIRKARQADIPAGWGGGGGGMPEALP